MYDKLTELTALLAELVEIQELTDTIILQVWNQHITAMTLNFLMWVGHDRSLQGIEGYGQSQANACLLYTSDAADE